MGPCRLRGRPQAQGAPLAARPCRGGPEAWGEVPPSPPGSAGLPLPGGEPFPPEKGCSLQPPTCMALGPVACMVAPSWRRLLGSRSREGARWSPKTGTENGSMITLPTSAQLARSAGPGFRIQPSSSRKHPEGEGFMEGSPRCTCFVCM